MPDHTTKITLTEEMIRERSYYIWQREGCPEGRDKMHWDMACCELEAELLEASVIGETASIVLPRIPISRPPHLLLAGPRTAPALPRKVQHKPKQPTTHP